MQKDRYTRRDDTLNPLTNTDLDQMWEAFPESHDGAGEPKMLFLSGQLGDNGRLLQFRSLFFCTRTKRFWEPCCPACGFLLEVCSRDELLASLGLPTYSGSLQRFLICPQCISASEPQGPWYSYEVSPYAPDFVQDWRMLVRQFRQFLSSGDPGHGFPCCSCRHAPECHAESGADPPIVPFAFYPFYLLIFEAPSLQATDFLALLGGASKEDLANLHTAQGDLAGAAGIIARSPDVQTRRALFFNRADSRFLEVLCLKLFVLQGLCERYWEKQDAGIELSEPDLNSWWIRLFEPSSLLPLFWTFQVIRSPADRVFAHPGAPDRAAFQEIRRRLGLTWFLALLCNEQQTLQRVSQSLQELMEGLGDPLDQEFLESILDADPVFAPHNIFWRANALDLPPACERFWKESLILGLRFLMEEEQAFQSSDTIQAQLQSLLDRLQSALFHPIPTLQPALTDNEASASVFRILKSIGGRWREQLENEAALSDDPGLSGIPESDEETLLLSPHPNNVRQAGEDAEFLDQTYMETMIISSASDQEKGNQLQERASGQNKAAFQVEELGDELPETMILDGGQGKTLQGPDSKVRVSEQQLQFGDEPAPEKVSLHPEKGRISFSKEPEEESDLEKTLIQKPGAREHKDSK